MHVRLLLFIGLTAMLGALVLTALMAPIEPEPDAERAPAAAPSPEPVDAELSPRERDEHPEGEEPRIVSADERNQHLRVDVGERVRIQVRTSTPEVVQLGREGPIEVAEPYSPAEFELLAEEGLDEPILLLEPERRIGRISARR